MQNTSYIILYSPTLLHVHRNKMVGQKGWHDTVDLYAHVLLVGGMTCWGHYLLGTLLVGGIICWGHYLLGGITCWGHYLLGALLVGDITCWGHYLLGALLVGGITRWGHYSLGTLLVGDITCWGHYLLGVYDTHVSFEPVTNKVPVLSMSAHCGRTP